MTDDTILSMLSDRDSRDEGFRVLISQYGKPLYKIIRSRVKSHEDADDVLQNTLVKVYRHIGSFEKKSGLYTWIYRIACNEAITFNAKEHKLRVENIAMAEMISSEPFYDSHLWSGILEQMVNDLPPQQQRIFRMRYYDELTYAQIAELTGLTEGSLKASYHHAVKKIEQQIKSGHII